MEPAFTGIKNIGYIKTTLNHAAMSIIKDDNNGYRRIPLHRIPEWRKVIF